MKNNIINYQLPYNFYQIPETANATVTTQQLKSLMLATSGYVFSCGRTYLIEKRNLGAGVYDITLKRKELPASKNQKNLSLALKQMVELYEKETGKKREDLPEFIQENL